MQHKILVPLATGFEEIEALTIVDVLRRADLDVTVAGIGQGLDTIPGAHGIRVAPDAPLAALDLDEFDVVVLPGGMGGTLAMIEEERLLERLRSLAREGQGLTAAICAAPMVLVAAGVVDEVPITSHPSVRDRLGKAPVSEARVVHSGRVITSQGPGTAMEFALALVGELAGNSRKTELAGAMVVQGP